MAPPAIIAASEGSGSLTLRAEGSWLVANAAELDSHLHALDLPTGRLVTLDLAGIERLDTAGAWLLLRTEHALSARGNTVALENVQASFAPLLEQVRARREIRRRHEGMEIALHHVEMADRVEQARSGGGRDLGVVRRDDLVERPARDP